MKKTGFTLVELLAGIVILAIIFTIAIPSVSSVIVNYRTSAFEKNTEMILTALRYKLIENADFDITSINESNIESELRISNKNIELLIVTNVSDKPHVLINGKGTWDGLVAYGTNKEVMVKTDDEYDNEVPVITILGNNPVTVTVGGAYVDEGATAIDNIDGDITSSIEITGEVNTQIVGTYYIKYNVTDFTGNEAVEVVRTVNVEDATIPFGMTYYWDTGDISPRVTWYTETFDKDHNGDQYIIASVQHGVNAYNPDGVLQWSYTGITNGYDIRDIAVGDLQETGYNDTIVIVSGYSTSNGWNQIGIVDRNGNELADIKLNHIGKAYRGVIAGTDIYIGGDYGVTKLIKSGSTWVEDTTNWDKGIGTVRDMYWGDLGNGPRLIVSVKSSVKDLYCYQSDGTIDWDALYAGGYDGRLEIGKVDNTIAGQQIVKNYQGGAAIYDKDGNFLASLTTGTNVRTGLTIYDNDGDGEKEIYISDMGQDIYVWNRTGVNTYTVQYSKLDIYGAGVFAGLTNYDIDEDGENEIIASTTDGKVYVFSKDLSIVKKEINVGHGQIGTYDTAAYCIRAGIKIVDVNGDGHKDFVISGGTGYVDVFINDY